MVSALTSPSSASPTGPPRLRTGSTVRETSPMTAESFNVNREWRALPFGHGLEDVTLLGRFCVPATRVATGMHNPNRA